MKSIGISLLFSACITLSVIAMQVTPDDLNKYKIPKIKDYYSNEWIESDDDNQTNSTNNSVLYIMAQKPPVDSRKEHLRQQIATGKTLAYRIGLLLRLADESDVCTKFTQRPYLITRQFIMEQTDNGFMPCYVTVSKEDQDKLEDDTLVRCFKKLDKVDNFHLHFPRQ